MSHIQHGGESLRERPLLWESERDLRSSADSKRDLAVMDVGECRLGARSGFFLGPAMGLLVCQVCCSLETSLIRWDTCQDLDEGQNVTTTICKSRYDGNRSSFNFFSYLFVLFVLVVF